MRPRTRTATSSEEPSPIHFDHSHPWNANDRRGQGLVLELVGFQITFLRHLLADLLSGSTHLTALIVTSANWPASWPPNQTRDENHQRSRSS